MAVKFEVVVVGWFAFADAALNPADLVRPVAKQGRLDGFSEGPLGDYRRPMPFASSAITFEPSTKRALSFLSIS